MDYEIIVSPKAAEQLRAITAWIARDNPDRARSFTDELLRRLEVLATFPSLGTFFLTSNCYRKLVSSNYLIVYLIRPERKEVEVVSFRHAGRKPRLPDLNA